MPPLLKKSHKTGIYRFFFAMTVKRVQGKVRKRITYSGESHYPLPTKVEASPPQTQTHKSSFDSRFDTKCAFVPASQLRIKGAHECMLLSAQIDILKARFDSYQADLHQKGTSDVEHHMIKAPVFQQCFDLKCALQHTIKNYKVFEEVLQALMLSQVSKARFVSSNQVHQPYRQ